MKILVTQSGMKHSLGMIRSLALQGHSVYGLVGPKEKQPLSRYSKYCRRVFSLNQEIETVFMDELTALLDGEAFDVLIPVGFPVTHFVAKHRDEIRRHVHVLAPDLESEQIANDKYAVQQLAASIGVPSPKTFLVENPRDIAQAIESVGLPVIIKGRRESGKGIVATASTNEDALRKFDFLISKFSLPQKDLPVLQEFVPGWGCGFFAIYDNGECKRTFMHRRIREYPPTGGVSCCARSFHDARLSALGMKVLDALRWNGVAMAEFRYDERKQDYCLIEVNAKFWGSLELALAAGADFPGDYVKIATGRHLEFSDSYRETTYQWLLSGDLLHGLKKPSAIPSILSTVFNPKVQKDYLCFDDPRVLFMRFYRLFKEILNLIVRAN